jgi:hypothetical protein
MLPIRAFSVNKCLTFPPKEEKGKKGNKLQIDINNLNKKILKDTLPFVEYSKKGNFAVHFAKEGEHAVNLKDDNLNNIPDFVDSVLYYMEYVYQKEVFEMKYESPIPDEEKGRDTAYDVYLLELGKSRGAYGFTNSSQIKLNSKYKNTYYSFIVIDNDYSETDSSFTDFGEKTKTYLVDSIMGIKITAAHEFHHAIQFVYNLQFENMCIPEMTSSAMENHLFPESNDLFVRMRILTSFPFATSLSNTAFDNGYTLGVFGWYIFEKEELGEKVWLNAWQMIGNDINPLKAIDSSMFLNSGFNIDYYWKDFAVWLYHTGKRSVENSYFKYANRMPMLRFENLIDSNKNNVFFNPPKENYSFNLMPFTIGTYRKIFLSGNNQTDDTLDVLQVNIDRDNLLNLNQTNSNNLMQIDFDNALNAKVLEFNRFTVYAHNTNKETINQIYFLKKGSGFKDLGITFPQPFDKSKDKILTLGTPSNMKPYSQIDGKLKIFNLDFSLVYSQNIKAEVKEDYKYVQLDNISSILNAGIYIFKVEYEDEDEYFKVVVK